MRVPQKRRERGAILITALLLLLVLTILGTSSLQNTVLQERMVGNMHNRNLAFQSSEAALRGGEEWLCLDEGRFPPETSGGLDNDKAVWVLDAPGSDADLFWWEDAKAPFWQNEERKNTREMDSFCEGACLVVENPRFLIEHRFFRPDSLKVGHGVPTGTDYHRVTTLGVGRSTKARVVLQSVYAGRYDR